MADKKAVLVFMDTLDCSCGAVEQMKKKAALLPRADTAGLKELAAKLGGQEVAGDAAAMKAAFENGAALLVAQGGTALGAALEAADRRTLISVAAANGAAFTGMAINAKAGTVERAVNAQDLAVTIAAIADLAIDETCTGAIIYQALKNPNFKLDETKKLQEALMRMESVLQRDNREPWDKHDCA